MYQTIYNFFKYSSVIGIILVVVLLIYSAVWYPLSLIDRVSYGIDKTAVLDAYKDDKYKLLDSMAEVCTHKMIYDWQCHSAEAKRSVSFMRV